MNKPMPKVLFILGGGPRIGYSVAKRFVREGYKVAIGRRTLAGAEDHKDLEGVFFVAVDVSSRDSVQLAFGEVTAKLGIPNVVVYNAAALIFPDTDDPFSISPADFEQNLAVNVSGGYSALHQATRGFLTLKTLSGDTIPLVFIATGNVTPFQPIPTATTLGSGKAALAYLIQVGMKAYEKTGFCFYFASQVTDDGQPVPYRDVSGAGHGEVYWNLVNRDLLRELWDVRFVSNKNDTKVKVDWESA